MPYIFESLLGLVVLFLVLGTGILPWIQLFKIRNLQEELAELRAQIAVLKGVAPPPDPVALRTTQAHVINQTIAIKNSDIAELDNKEHEVIAARITPDTTAVQHDAPEPEVHVSHEDEAAKLHDTPKDKRTGFEMQFGAKLPAYIGGAALVFAVLFLVKYSISLGLLGPVGRTVIGFLFGSGLLVAEQKLRQRSFFTSSPRVAQALIGAGASILYICTVAATEMLDILPAFLGFFMLAGITAYTVVQSLRYGAPIAIMGFLGGFLAPNLLGGMTYTPLTLLYLLFVFAGVFRLIQQRGWWFLSVPSMLISFAWVMAWLGHKTAQTSMDSFALGLFLLGISAIVAHATREQRAAAAPTTASLPAWMHVGTPLQLFSAAGSLLLMTQVIMVGGVSVMDLGMFAVLSLGSIALAFFRPHQYGFTPWVALGLNVAVLALWPSPSNAMLCFAILSFAMLFIGSGLALSHHAPRPILWGYLALVAQVGYFILAYWRLHLHPVEFSALFQSVHSWWAIALMLALGNLSLLKRALPRRTQATAHLLAAYVIGTTSFVSLALMIGLPHEIFSVALAVEVMIVLWVAGRLELPVLQPIALVLALYFGFLLLPQVLLLIQLSAYSLVEAKLALLDGLPLVDHPLFQLGVPSVCLMVGANQLHRVGAQGRFCRSLEIAAVTLFAVMGYYLARHALHPGENILFIKAGFFERGVISNAIALYGLACMAAGNRFSRQTLHRCGLVLFGVAMFRVVYFDLLIHNPMLSDQHVGTLPLLNSLLLTYVLPALYCLKALPEYARAGYTKIARIGSAFPLILIFTYLTLATRQLFQGEQLNLHEAGNAEFITYSLVWLLYGLTLLGIGVKRNIQMLRIASLLVILLTVGKVFLLDASVLEGFLRVLSFFMLGICLLGLSYFYTRVIFKSN